MSGPAAAGVAVEEEEEGGEGECGGRDGEGGPEDWC